jgi:hypothetical protein
MASKKIPDVPAAGALVGSEELHLVAGVTRDGGGNVTNNGNSRRSTLQAIANFVINQVVIPAAGISQAFADGRYLQKAANLGDVADVPTARNNLSVYSKAQVDAAVAGAAPSGMPFEIAVSKPAAANFTTQNLAGGSIASTFADYAKGVAILQLGSIGATNQIRFARHDVIASGTPFTMTARMTAIDPQQPLGQATQGSLVLRNSANGRMILFGDGGGGVTSYVQIFSTYTSGQLGLYTSFSVSYQFPWKRIVSDGTNLTFWVSKDGYYWVQGAAGTTIANYIGVVDELGIGLQAIASVTTAHGTLCQSFAVSFP